MSTHAARLNTVFHWCNDIAATRRFYTELLGLEETYFDEKQGWLTYQIGELNVVFIRGSSPQPVLSEWARQPAYRGGKIEAPSWVIQVSPKDFPVVVLRLKAAGVPEFQKEPMTPKPGYAMFFVRDPMGTTIEIYAEGVTAP